ncbi:MAG: nitroreductase [Solirubrobacterales bacterium]|nr:nitroreductase [Solirubrobacterales bacterium]
MEVFEAIAGRRTVKAFAGPALTPDELEPLFDAARWAPNHKLTEPWRFRVVGEASRSALKIAAAGVAVAHAPDGADAKLIGAVAAKKLDRAPTLIAVSCVRNADPVLEAEDFAATAVASYIVLLTAHANGFAGYWRTPEVLRDNAGTEALGIEPDEDVLGLLYLGRPDGALPPPPDRASPARFVTYLE